MWVAVVVACCALLAPCCGGLDILNAASVGALSRSSFPTNVFSTKVGRQDNAGLVVANLTHHSWVSVCSLEAHDEPFVRDKLLVVRDMTCEPHIAVERAGALGVVGIILLNPFPFTEPSFCRNCRFSREPTATYMYAMSEDEAQEGGLVDALEDPTVTLEAMTTLADNAFEGMHESVAFLVVAFVLMPVANFAIAVRATHNLYKHFVNSRQDTRKLRAQSKVPHSTVSECVPRCLLRGRPGAGTNYDFSISLVPRLALCVEVVECLIRCVQFAVDPPFAATGVFLYRDNVVLLTIGLPLHSIVHFLAIWFYRRLYVLLNLKSYHWLGHVVDPSASAERSVLFALSICILAFDLFLGILKGVGWGHADAIGIQVGFYVLLEVCTQTVQVVTIARVVRLLRRGKADSHSLTQQNTRHFVVLSTRWMAMSCVGGVLLVLGAAVLGTQPYTVAGFYTATACVYVGLTISSLAHVVALTPVSRANSKELQRRRQQKSWFHRALVALGVRKRQPDAHGEAHIVDDNDDDDPFSDGHLVDKKALRRELEAEERKRQRDEANELSHATTGVEMASPCSSKHGGGPEEEAGNGGAPVPPSDPNP